MNDIELSSEFDRYIASLEPMWPVSAHACSTMMVVENLSRANPGLLPEQVGRFEHIYGPPFPTHNDPD